MRGCAQVWCAIGGRDIRGSPFTQRVGRAKGASSIDGAGLRIAALDQPATFTVRLCEADRAAGLPYVEVVPPPAARSADVAIKRALEPGVFVVTWVPAAVGPHTVHVRLGCMYTGTEIGSSPHTVVVQRAAAGDAAPAASKREGRTALREESTPRYMRSTAAVSGASALTYRAFAPAHRVRANAMCTNAQRNTRGARMTRARA